MARNYKSIAEPKTLTANLPSDPTDLLFNTVTLNNTTGLPTAPFILVIDADTSNEEVILCNSSAGGSSYNVTRATESGATPKPHTALTSTARHMIVGSDLQIVHDHFSNDNTSSGTAHGATGGVVGRTNSQTLTNKTINLTDNTLSGTVAQFNTALSNGDFATTALLEARVPVGAVNMWVTGTAPSGWLLCQGQELAIADYSALSGVLGTTYGALTNGSGASGTTHFRLPDLRGRTPMGAGTGSGGGVTGTGLPTGGQALTARTLGGFTGDERTPKHTHPNALTGTTSFASTGHTHLVINETASTWPYYIGNGLYYTEGNTIANYGQVRTAEPSASASVGLSNAEAGTGETANVQPATVINFIIKF
jgi:microcystin-dependent protein